MKLSLALRTLVLAAPLLAAAPVAAQDRPQVVHERWDNRAPPERGLRALRNVMLVAHADTRAAVGQSRLMWSDALAADADAYARELARTRRFAHARQPANRPRQGENLWMGTRGAYSYADMAGSWIGERRDFRPGRVPNVSRTGRFGDVGHYTQMIWATTTAVGCALAANRTDEYLVCRYGPAGNVVGRDPFGG